MDLLNCSPTSQLLLNFGKRYHLSPLITVMKMTGKMLFANIICQLKRSSVLIDAIICEGRTLVSLPEDPLSREIPLLENVAFQFFFFHM